MPTAARAAKLACAVALCACTTWSAPATTRATAPTAPRTSVTAARVYQGRVTYEARTLTLQGYSLAAQVHPARFVVVEARDAANRVVASTETDALGAFSLTAPASIARVQARSVVTHARRCAPSTPARECPPTMDMRVTRDPMGRTPYALSVSVPPASSSPPSSPASSSPGPLVLHASLAEPESLGGAFHILDTLVLGAQAVYRWSARELPPFFTIWSHASGTDWSYYRGERPARSNRFALELMGGEAGALATTDADEHDVYIVLHEFGHFVFDRLSSDASIGGMHPATVLIDPGVAWEEGRATWFACAVLGDARYRDAVGIEPAGTLRQDDDIEQLPPTALRGLGSQRSVQEILWDLSDGAPAGGASMAVTEGLPDRDNDGIALGPAAVFEAMRALRDVHDTVPSMLTLLHELVRTGRITEAQASALLRRPVDHGFALAPARTADPWPIALAPGQPLADKVDGLTEPAPSGGRAHPVNGFDAVRAYRVLVPGPRGATLVASVQIAGSGTESDHTNVRLELRDGRANLVPSSEATAQGPARSLRRALDPGVYLLLARDSGSGTRASFTVRYQLEPR